MHQPRGRAAGRRRVGRFNARASYAAAAARRWMAGLLALVFALSPAGAGAQQAEAVRAAFVLNFLKFAEWPAATPADSASALVIAALGDDAQSAALHAGLDGKEIQGRRITVRVFQDAEQWRREGKGCQALFITPSAAETWAELRAEIAGQPVLTICESPGFCEQGGMINLYEDDHRIRFEANPAAADQAGLKLRSTLLTLATIVKTKGGK
ncbi:MAG: YfiR family protein [bacterium]|nr:YfiR family protein [bacterium]